MQTWNIFWVDLSSQVHNLSFVCWILYTSAWSDERCSRHRVNITSRWVTRTGRHVARSHLFVYITTTLGVNVIRLLQACKCRSWISQCGRDLLEIISFFHSSRNLGFIFAAPNFTDGFLRPSNGKMKLRANVILFVTYVRYVALIWCRTSPSYIKGQFLHRYFRVCISFEAAVCCNDGIK